MGGFVTNMSHQGNDQYNEARHEHLEENYKGDSKSLIAKEDMLSRLSVLQDSLQDCITWSVWHDDSFTEELETINESIREMLLKLKTI